MTTPGTLPNNERLDRRDMVMPRHRDARTAAIWSRIQTRPHAGRLARMRYVLLGAGLGLATMGAWALQIATEGSVLPMAGTVLQAHADPSTMALPDGSRIDLRAHTSLRVTAANAEHFAVTLQNGEATFDVAKVPGRVFSVNAGHAQVRVLGTRFVVTRQQSAKHLSVRVEVLRGRVVVTSGGQERVLTPGEQWSVEESVQNLDYAQSADEPGTQDNLQAVPHKPMGLTVPAQNARPPRMGTASKLRPESNAPALLFEAAARARIEGDDQKAAGLYQTFLRRHPKDARATLMAFELGRTRMDVLSDPDGAAEAFEQSLALNPRPTMQADALSRLVRLYDKMRAFDRCAHHRQRLLARFAEGPQAAAVQGLCQPR